MNAASNKSELLQVLGSYTFHRILISAWAIAVLLFYPAVVGDWEYPTFKLYSQLRDKSVIGDTVIQTQLLWPWYRWDTEWYLRIAVDGYQPGGSTAFAPVYPALIKSVGFLLGGEYLIASLLISNAALILGLWLLFKEAQREFDQGTAGRAVIYLLAFPTAFYLATAYSESLFLLLSLSCWTCARRDQWAGVSIFAILAVLTRFQGAGLAIPLLYLWWRSPKPRSRWGIILAASPFVSLLWAAFLHFVLKLEYPWQALAQNWNQRLAFPWSGIIGNISDSRVVKTAGGEDTLRRFYYKLAFSIG